MSKVIELYSAKLLCYGHTFYEILSSNETILFSSKGWNTSSAKIYGGGEYIVWPREKEIIKQNRFNNYLFSFFFFVSAGVHYANR